LNTYKNKRRLRLATTLFLLLLLTSTAFAATSGMLTFGGTVRINHMSVVPDELRLEFISTSVREIGAGETRVTAFSEIASGRQAISFDVHFADVTPDAFDARAEVYFQFQNTGTVPVRLLDFDMTANGPQLNFQLQGGMGVGSVIAPGQVVDGFVVASLGDFLDFGDASFSYSFALSYEQGQ
jgi:type 1 fimbria pilin